MDIVTAKLREDIATLHDRSGERMGEFKAVATDWAENHKPPFTIVQPPNYGRAIAVVEHRDPPALLSVIAAEVIHASRVVVDHIQRVHRKVPTPQPWPPADDVSRMIVEVDNSCKHQRLPTTSAFSTELTINFLLPEGDITQSITVPGFTGPVEPLTLPGHAAPYRVLGLIEDYPEHLKDVPMEWRCDMMLRFGSGILDSKNNPVTVNGHPIEGLELWDVLTTIQSRTRGIREFYDHLA